MDRHPGERRRGRVRHSGYEPDKITHLYPDLSLGDVHRALADDYDNIDDFRSAEPATV